MANGRGEKKVKERLEDSRIGRKKKKKYTWGKRSNKRQKKKRSVEIEKNGEGL